MYKLNKGAKGWRYCKTARSFHPIHIPFSSVPTLAAVPQPYPATTGAPDSFCVLMGNCASVTQDREASLRSADIDRNIEEDSKKFKKECKILLLGMEWPLSLTLLTKLTQTAINPGSGESGKSTVVKQMKIIHQDGFSPEERIAYRPAIYQNLLESAQAIIFAMYKLSIEPMDAQNRVCHLFPPASYTLTRQPTQQETLRQIARYDLKPSFVDSNFRFPEQLALSINRLWRDPVIPQIMDYHSSEFYLMDSAS
jgi:guanine nucleotide-binding protein G(i) subunit alpha